MSADTFKPTANMTVREIAVPAAPSLQPNQPLPAGVRVERQEVGRLNSPNESGGYCDIGRSTSNRV